MNINNNISESIAISPDAKPRADVAESNLKMQVRKSNARGHAEHGWLNSYHTFSFAGYHDPSFAGYHSFRVLNEDRVIGGEGFGTHPHSEYEIFSYVVSGGLQHRDSMNNNEIIGRGDVQFTSAGTGISHSEFNASPNKLVHFLQMWVKPNQRRLKPSYQTKSFTDAAKEGKLCLIVSPDGSNDSVTIHQDVSVYASILRPDQATSLPVRPGRDFYVHVIQDATGFDTEANKVGLKVNGQLLRGGDGAFLRGLGDKSSANEEISFVGASEDLQKVEFLVFDIKQGS